MRHLETIFREEDNLIHQMAPQYGKQSILPLTVSYRIEDAGLSPGIINFYSASALSSQHPLSGR